VPLEFEFEGAGVGDAEVEDAGGEGGVGFAAAWGVAEYFGEVLGGAGATGGDDGDLDSGGDAGGELEVEAGAHAVGVHGGEEDLAGAALLGLAGPVEEAEAGGFATAGDEDFGLAGGVCGQGIFAGVDGDDDGLGTEALADLGDERRS